MASATFEATAEIRVAQLYGVTFAFSFFSVGQMTNGVSKHKVTLPLETGILHGPQGHPSSQILGPRAAHSMEGPISRYLSASGLRTMRQLIIQAGMEPRSAVLLSTPSRRISSDWGEVEKGITLLLANGKLNGDLIKFSRKSPLSPWP